MIPELFTVALVLASASPAPAGLGANKAVDRREAGTPPAPKPELTPRQVVRTVLDALKDNDKPHQDAGIETAFAFASPANKEATGPLGRFARMVKGPSYRTMIGYKSAEYGPLTVQGDRALQRVKLIGAAGESVEYGFGLSKDPKTDCWMTDAVFIIPPPVEPPRRDKALARRMRSPGRPGFAGFLGGPVMSGPSHFLNALPNGFGVPEDGDDPGQARRFAAGRV